MSHFLARLVERTRGTAPRVAPLIAPRFAPGGIAEITEEGVAAAAAPPPSLTPQTDTRLVAPKKSPLEAPQPRSTHPAPNESVAPEPESASAPDPIEIVEETLLVPVPAATAPQSPDAAGTGGSGPLRRDVLPHVQAPSAPPLAAHTNPPNGSRPAQPRPPTPPPRAKTPAIPPRPQSAAEPPIVRVTIGRIDVRAAPAPAGPARRPARDSKPKLTLDAYLKSRREGAR